MSHVAATTPYAWPYDGVLDPTRLALVVCGWDDEWYRAVAEPRPALSNIFDLAEAVEVVVTVAHRRAARWPLAEPAPPAPLPAIHDVHLRADGVDGFYGSALDPVLRRAGITTVLVAGLGLETTVHSTLRTANDAGLECLVVADACAPVDPTIVDRTLSMIEMSGGIFGAVGTTANVLAALEGVS